MPRVTLLDHADAADVKVAVALLVAGGADPVEALAAVDTLVAGIHAYVDVERPDGLVADLAAMGIEARVMADDGSETAD